MQHAKLFPSVAEDKNNNERFTQYVLTRVMNKLNSLHKISDTQAAACLLGFIVFFCSESFKFCDAESFILFIKNGKKCSQLADNPSDWSDGISNSEHNLDSSDDSDEDDDDRSQDSFIVSNEQNDTDTTMFDNDSSLPDKHSDNSRITDNDRKPALHRTINVSKSIAPSPAEMAYYESAYGSCPLYSVDEGTQLVAITSPILYRFRGKSYRISTVSNITATYRLSKIVPTKMTAYLLKFNIREDEKNQHTFISVQALKYMPTTTRPS